VQKQRLFCDIGLHKNSLPPVPNKSVQRILSCYIIRKHNLTQNEQKDKRAYVIVNNNSNCNVNQKYEMHIKVLELLNTAFDGKRSTLKKREFIKWTAL
jgi:hypothetical protein